jgi:hypothetical protein
MMVVRPLSIFGVVYNSPDLARGLHTMITHTIAERLHQAVRWPYASLNIDDDSRSQ